MSSTTEHKYIQLNEQGTPIIAGTTMKVVELITAQFAHGWSPEELHFQYPYLSMSQIHSALAYYWDHKLEVDAEIEQRYQYAEDLRQAAGESPFVARLRAQGLLKQ
ncbi:MAG TPA: DUF433 domain-containing protein [Microcoleaceae cyanobacterium]